MQLPKAQSFGGKNKMCRFLRTRILSAGAALLLTATATADIFGQSSSMAAEVSNSASPKNIASSNSTSRKAATPKSPSTVGNFPVIVPSKLNDGPRTNEDTNKATDKAANKSGANDNSAAGDNAAPPSPAPPSPQGQVSAALRPDVFARPPRAAAIQRHGHQDR